MSNLLSLAGSSIRIRERFISIALLPVYLFLVALPCGTSQIPRAATTPVQQLVRRDAAAMATIRAALEAMGGASAWSAMHGAKVTGTTASDGSDQSTAFEWSDDWSGQHRMKRDYATAAGGPHHVYLQDGTSRTQSLSSPTSNGSAKTPRKPTFDSVSALILHLPGAALSLALGRPAYGITSAVPPRSSPPNTACVQILQTSTKDPLTAGKVSICFSATSSLPISADVTLPDLFHLGNQHDELVQFREFQPAGSLLVPREVSVTKPSKKIDVITIEAVAWNPAFSATTFSGVTQ